MFSKETTSEAGQEPWELIYPKFARAENLGSAAKSYQQELKEPKYLSLIGRLSEPREPRAEMIGRLSEPREPKCTSARVQTGANHTKLSRYPRAQTRLPNS